MKKTPYVLSLLALGIGLNFTGMGGCGSSSGGTTTPTETSADLTTSEQQTALDLVSSDQERSQALQNVFNEGFGALTANGTRNQEAIEFECPVSGSISFDLDDFSEDSFDFNFNDCMVLLEPEEDLETGFVNYTFDGVLTFTQDSDTQSTLTQDLVVTRDPQDEGEETTSCDISGTIVNTSNSETSSTSVYNTVGACTNGTATTTGSLTATYTGTGESFEYLIDGTLVSTFTSTGRAVVCTYNDFNVGTATCADYAQACGLDADIVCN